MFVFLIACLLPGLSAPLSEHAFQDLSMSELKKEIQASSETVPSLILESYAAVQVTSGARCA